MFLLFVLAAVVLAYLLVGTALLNRGMAYVRANALLDRQFLSMAVTDGRSLSMTLPKIAFVLFWLPTLIAFLIVMAVRAAMQPGRRAAAV